MLLQILFFLWITFTLIGAVILIFVVVDKADDYRRAKDYDLGPKRVAKQAKEVKVYMTFLFTIPLWPLYAPVFAVYWVYCGLKNLACFVKEINESIAGPNAS